MTLLDGHGPCALTFGGRLASRPCNPHQRRELGHQRRIAARSNDEAAPDMKYFGRLPSVDAPAV
jgi:hypothetical protein